MDATTPADDAKLVAGCLRGNADAFGGLVTRYRALAVAAAYSVCGDRALAEDIAQEAFVLAYRRLKQLVRRECFCAWLLNIVRNAALRAVRNVARRDEVHKLASEGRGPHTENPGAAIEFADLLARVDDEAQQILILHYHQGMTCAEIGGVLGVPTGTVTSKISRALGSLREHLRRENRV